MQCEYEEMVWRLGNKTTKGYRCYGEGKIEIKERGFIIDGIRRKDPEAYPQPENFADASELQLIAKDILYFPKGLQKFFQHLLNLELTLSKLKEIKQEDLKVFPDLQALNLNFNFIEVLEKDLFKFNPKLRTIRMHSNSINFIDQNIVDDLKVLSVFILGSNTCINFSAKNRASVVNFLTVKIKNNCLNYGELEITKKVEKTGTQHGKYFWVLVGCGVIVGVFLMFAVLRTVYLILKKN
ncbi:unnamed protein product [Chironomus riparius]|uniref:Uncharacterized protein n=1 Tax=Chironomus riparius TaxID=315576 RepID=A0A9N9S6P9_9DIPT|nr:unnamed protein product [Chironomus riparius]